MGKVDSGGTTNIMVVDEKNTVLCWKSGSSQGGASPDHSVHRNYVFTIMVAVSRSKKQNVRVLLESKK